MLRAAVIVFLLALLPAPAQAEARFALLIGNAAYASEIGRLANPYNDVALLEQALKGLGFEVVTVRDAGLGALTRAINCLCAATTGDRSGRNWVLLLLWPWCI